MASEPHEDTIARLIGHIFRSFGALLQNESRLARAELSEEASKLSGAMTVMAVGAALALPALVIFLQAIVATLVDAGWRNASASLVVGLTVLALATLFVLAGLARLKAVSFVPTKTLRQIRKDFAIVEETNYEHDVQHAA